MKEGAILYAGQSLALEVLTKALQENCHLPREERVKWWAGFMGGAVQLAASDIGHEATEVMRTRIIPVTTSLANSRGKPRAVR